MRYAIAAVAWVLVWCGSLVGGARGADGGKMNVLFICVDDLKPVLGCYGDKLAKTPNIDRLARSGVRFEAAYCNQAVCAPSRNALMTGLRPTTIGVYDLETNFRVGRPDAVTMGEWFKSTGWRTEAMGKIFHVGHGNTGDARSWSVPHWAPGGPAYVAEESLAAIKRVERASGRVQSKGPAVERAEVGDEAYGDGRLAAEAVRRLGEAKGRGEPFFMMVGFVRPHLPFNAPKKYWDLYEREKFEPAAVKGPPAGAPEFAKTEWGELRTYSDIPKQGELSEAQQRELIHGYYAATSYMDAQVGRLLDELERLGLWENTVVVLWGDHGWHLGDHGMWCKHTNYEQAARIPLIVRAPGRGAGGVSKALVESVDVYPTLGELLGVGAPGGLDGRSFAGVLEDPGKGTTKEAVFHAYPRNRHGGVLGRAVRTERYRMVEWKRPGAKAGTAVVELYDYQEDPGETKNLAGERAEVVGELRKLLEAQGEAVAQVRRR